MDNSNNNYKLNCKSSKKPTLLPRFARQSCLPIILTSIIFLCLISFSLVGAVECNASFINKINYNICYLPNVTTTQSFNITDKSNSTILSYYRESTTAIGSQTYYSNFSDLKNYNGQDYIIYTGSQDSFNSTVYGIIYFFDDKIVFSSERRMFANYSGNERMSFYNYNTTKFILSNGSESNNIAGGTGVFIGSTLIKAVSDLKNYSIQSFTTRILVNKTFQKSYLIHYH